MKRSVITPALQQRLGGSDQVRVLFDLNPGFPEGRRAAARMVRDLLAEASIRFGDMGAFDSVQELRLPNDLGRSYLVALCVPDAVRWIVHTDLERSDVDFRGDWSKRAIRQIWPDFEVFALLEKSVATVKGDAAHATFGAFGGDITWAVVDSGVDGNHPHFERWGNLVPPEPLDHHDLTGAKASLVDQYGIGHGTAVAGIIAGEVVADGETGSVGFGKVEARRLRVRRTLADSDETLDEHTAFISKISGVAPQCKILSYKVFDSGRPAYVSSVIAALEHIQEMNDFGRNIRIHGVNLSLGYPFYPEWFVGGYSPLCEEVDRLVASGVVVVVAAGNSGFVQHQPGQSLTQGDFDAGVTINDPGNSISAVTVGSSHRDAPHRYGVSFFSSKGPTADGRIKPDLVAPGSQIITCASSGAQPGEDDDDWDYPHYTEFTGTSMAAAHVSGAIAAFLSVRREFIGHPERVKEIFLKAATDIGRVREFQGNGLVNVLRAIQSV